MLTRHDLFAGSPEASYRTHPYQYASRNPVNWRDPSGLLADDPEVDESTGITNYQLTPEEIHVAAFSYATVVGSPGIVFGDVRVWASANGILHKREAGDKYVVQHICHTSFGCTYVFEDNPIARRWISGYESARAVALIVIGLIATATFIAFVAGALHAAFGWSIELGVGCGGLVVQTFRWIVIIGIAWLVIVAPSLYIIADSTLHNQWNLVNDMRPIQPWPGNRVEP
jgi:hypothetical protein